METITTPEETENSPIQKEVLRDKIADVLRRWILNGTLQPGERIIELTVSRKLNVSRAPLREALWALERQGLVEIRPHHGATVTLLSEQSIREIFEIREILELHAAKKLRAHRDETATAALQQALSQLEEAARARDMARFCAADFEFHRTLWRLSGNRHLQEILESISARFFGYALIRDLPEADAYRFDAVVEEHRRMLGLVFSGSDAELEEGFRKSFDAFCTYVLARTAGPPSLPT
jgi:DNA-binding GntR family transcriptional regulator